ncbi:MAG: Holliday junction branch migration protein RuvA [Patescibacteria group bacterium]
MIRMLVGEIVVVADGYVTVLVGGVGYLVGTNTKGVAFRVGDPVTLHTHLAVRETALDLYGFVSISELDIFELLMQVPKIGPKSSLQIMNQASPTLLLEAIGKKDAAYLHKLSGIGKKTCENIVQFLHDKVEGMAFAMDLDVTSGLTEAQTDAIDALVSLGYDLTSARTSVKDLAGETANDLIRQALKQMP